MRSMFACSASASNSSEGVSTSPRVLPIKLFRLAVLIAGSGGRVMRQTRLGVKANPSVGFFVLLFATGVGGGYILIFRQVRLLCQWGATDAVSAIAGSLERRAIA